MMARSMQGAYYFGVSYVFLFLEVCSGTAKLTQAVRFMRLTTMGPVDKSTGWDLTRRKDVVKLKDNISIWRPLLTHLSPT